MESRNGADRRGIPGELHDGREGAIQPARLIVRTDPARRHGLQFVLSILLSTAAVSPGVAQQLAPDPSTEPFTPSQRWSHYLHRTYDPTRLGFLAVDTAVDNMMREPKCWDSGADSYGRRYARALERRVIRNTAELASGLLTGEDLRYRASRSTSFSGRVWNVARSSVTARMPDGTRRPAYTRFFAAAVADVSTAQWTRQPIRPDWLARSLAWSTLDQFQTNMMNEFGPDLRRFGTRVWKRIRLRNATEPRTP